MADQTPEEKLAIEQGRLATSERYLSRDDNPDLDPSRQDQLDKNRVPGEFGEEQLSPNSEVRARQAKREGSTSTGVTEILRESLSEQRAVTLTLAGMAGFILGALWKA